MGKFLSNLKEDKLKGIKVTSFDTRVKLFIHGDAMNKILSNLKNVGAEVISEPQAFYVGGKQGPLLDGEDEKAVEWAKLLKESVS
jgi:hypothetical protein